MKQRDIQPGQKSPDSGDLPLGPQDIAALVTRMQPKTPGAENFLKVASELHGVQALLEELSEFQSVTAANVDVYLPECDSTLTAIYELLNQRLPPADMNQARTWRAWMEVAADQRRLTQALLRGHPWEVQDRKAKPHAKDGDELEAEALERLETSVRKVVEVLTRRGNGKSFAPAPQALPVGVQELLEQSKANLGVSRDIKSTLENSTKLIAASMQHGTDRLVASDIALQDAWFERMEPVFMRDLLFQRALLRWLRDNGGLAGGGGDDGGGDDVLDDVLETLVAAAAGSKLKGVLTRAGKGTKGAADAIDDLAKTGKGAKGAKAAADAVDDLAKTGKGAKAAGAADDLAKAGSKVADAADDVAKVKPKYRLAGQVGDAAGDVAKGAKAADAAADAANGAATAGNGAATAGGKGGGWMSRIAKKLPFIGAAITLGAGAFEAGNVAADTSMSDKEKKQRYAEVAGGTAGSFAGSAGGAMAGASAGAMAGAALGSVVPILGTALGGIVGGAVGGIAGAVGGGLGGDWLGRKAANAVTGDPNETRKSETARLNAEGKLTPEQITAKANQNAADFVKAQQGAKVAGSTMGQIDSDALLKARGVQKGAEQQKADLANAAFTNALKNQNSAQPAVWKPTPEQLEQRQAKPQFTSLAAPATLAMVDRNYGDTSPVAKGPQAYNPVADAQRLQTAEYNPNGAKASLTQATFAAAGATTLAGAATMDAYRSGKLPGGYIPGSYTVPTGSNVPRPDLPLSPGAAAATTALAALTGSGAAVASDLSMPLQGMRTDMNDQMEQMRLERQANDEAQLEATSKNWKDFLVATSPALTILETMASIWKDPEKFWEQGKGKLADAWDAAKSGVRSALNIFNGNGGGEGSVGKPDNRSFATRLGDAVSGGWNTAKNTYNSAPNAASNMMDFTFRHESGKGGYSALNTNDVGGIAYGKIQFNSRSSGAFKNVIDDYLANGDKTSSNYQTIAKYAGDLKSNNMGVIQNNRELHAALKGAGSEGAMQQAQDRAIMKQYGDPALKAASNAGLKSLAAQQVLFDTNVNGGMDAVMKSTMAKLGGKVGDTRADGSVIDEKTFLNTFVDERKNRLLALAQNKAAKGDAASARALSGMASESGRIGELRSLVGKNADILADSTTGKVVTTTQGNIAATNGGMIARGTEHRYAGDVQARSLNDNLVQAANNSLFSETQKAINSGVKYGFGSKNVASGAIDCSGWVSHINGKMMDSVNEAAGKQVFTDKDKAAMKNSSEGIIQTIGSKTGNIMDNAALKQTGLREGMVIGMDTGNKGFDAGRGMGIDHVVNVVKDPNTGRMMVSESRGGKGVTMTDADTWMANQDKRGTKLFGVDPMALAAGGAGVAVAAQVASPGLAPMGASPVTPYGMPGVPTPNGMPALPSGGMMPGPVDLPTAAGLLAQAAQALMAAAAMLTGQPLPQAGQGQPSMPGMPGAGAGGVGALTPQAAAAAAYAYQQQNAPAPVEAMQPLSATVPSTPTAAAATPATPQPAPAQAATVAAPAVPKPYAGPKGGADIQDTGTSLSALEQQDGRNGKPPTWTEVSGEEWELSGGQKVKVRKETTYEARDPNAEVEASPPATGKTEAPAETPAPTATAAAPATPATPATPQPAPAQAATVANPATPPAPYTGPKGGADIQDTGTSLTALEQQDGRKGKPPTWTEVSGEEWEVAGGQKVKVRKETTYEARDPNAEVEASPPATGETPPPATARVEAPVAPPAPPAPAPLAATPVQTSTPVQQPAPVAAQPPASGLLPVVWQPNGLGGIDTGTSAVPASTPGRMQSFYANTKFAAYGAGQVPALQPQQPANPATQQRMQEYAQGFGGRPVPVPGLAPGVAPGATPYGQGMVQPGLRPGMQPGVQPAAPPARPTTLNEGVTSITGMAAPLLGSLAPWLGVASQLGANTGKAGQVMQMAQGVSSQGLFGLNLPGMKPGASAALGALGRMPTGPNATATDYVRAAVPGFDGLARTAGNLMNAPGALASSFANRREGVNGLLDVTNNLLATGRGVFGEANALRSGLGQTVSNYGGNASSIMSSAMPVTPALQQAMNLRLPDAPTLTGTPQTGNPSGGPTTWRSAQALPQLASPMNLQTDATAKAPAPASAADVSSLATSISTGNDTAKPATPSVTTMAEGAAPTGDIPMMLPRALELLQRG